MPGTWDIIIILLIIVVLFGSRRLPDSARSLGRSLRIFKSEMKELGNDNPSVQRQIPAQYAQQQPMQPGIGAPQGYMQPQQPYEPVYGQQPQPQPQPQQFQPGAPIPPQNGGQYYTGGYVQQTPPQQPMAGWPQNPAEVPQPQPQPQPNPGTGVPGAPTAQ